MLLKHPKLLRRKTLKAQAQRQSMVYGKGQHLQSKIIYLLFQDLGFLEKGTKAPFRMLREFQFADGANICETEFMGCSLSGYLLPNEYGYFGENNVSILDDATNKCFVMSEKDFYPYIKKYSNIYMENNSDKKAEVLN